MGGKVWQWESQDSAKQTKPSISSSPSSEKQPMNLADSSKLTQGLAVILDRLSWNRFGNECFSLDCEIQRQTNVNTRQQLHHGGTTPETVNGKSTLQRWYLGKHNATQKHIGMKFIRFWKVESNVISTVCSGCILVDLFVLWRVLPKLWPWCIRAPIIWLESILAGVIMYDTWPCVLCSSYTSSPWASTARGHGLHLRWWCPLSWNSLPNMWISHSPSVRLWLSYLLWEAVYALKRLVVAYPVLPWQFALLYNCSDGSHLLVAVFRCTAGRSLHSEKGGVIILFWPRSFTPSPHCC